MNLTASTLTLLAAMAQLGPSADSIGGPPMITEDFEFVSDGRTISGIIDRPANGDARALIVFAHGSGPTDVRRENRYVDLRSRFAQLGITSVVWDKPGQGRSDGEFDPNRPLEDEARELLDAVTHLRTQGDQGRRGSGSGARAAEDGSRRSPSHRTPGSTSGSPSAESRRPTTSIT